MLNYVLAFIFSADLSKVLLIRKSRPDWQKGRYNGLGGKIEVGENIMDAGRREITEESGLKVRDLIQVGNMNLEGEWLVEILAGIADAKAELSSGDEGKVQWVPVADLPKEVLPNLHWLVPLCINKFNSDLPFSIEQVRIHYSRI